MPSQLGMMLFSTCHVGQAQSSTLVKPF